MSIFWDRFYSVCLDKGTKPNSIAKDIGISSGILTKWKTQGSLPNGETLLSIANRLDCSVDYLLGRTENAKAHKDEVYSQEYTELFEKYMRLDDNDKIKITERIDTLLDDDKYKKIYSTPKEA